MHFVAPILQPPDTTGRIIKKIARVGKTTLTESMELMDKDFSVAYFESQLSLHGVDIERVMVEAGVNTSKTDS